MDSSIALILVQDGVVNGAIYALLALSLVLVFTVTRVVFIPQGEFVAYGALTFAGLQAGHLPGSVGLLCVLGGVAFIASLWAERREITLPGLLLLAAGTLGLPAAITGLAAFAAPRAPGVLIDALLALLIVTPISSYLYRAAFRPIAQASVLVLLIVAVSVHLALTGLGLVFFGPEGSRAAGFSEANFDLGSVSIAGQSLWVVGLAAALMAGLSLFFGHTLTGKALRATAVNRIGARLVGIDTARSGEIAFTLAGAIGALSGVLIVSLTTIYYDTGFLIGLKGFTAAIVGGLASYPVAAIAAIGVGVLESFSSFWASAFKEVIVFTAIIPVLLWRSLRQKGVEEEE